MTNTQITKSLKFEGPGGLLPVVVQDAVSKVVLMQAWMNKEALDMSIKSGKLTFFSRSKNRLWTKGETSGNFLMVKELLADCDQDCLLARVKPLGPVCHTGEDTCFGEVNLPTKEKKEEPGDDAGSPVFLLELEKVLKSRKLAGSSGSYTARLLQAGNKRIAKKLGEEAVELILEAEQGDRQRFVEEAADLLYHLNVLLIGREMGWKDVIRELENRHATKQPGS